MARRNPTPPPPGTGRKPGSKNVVPKQAKVMLAEAAREHTDAMLQALVDIATSNQASSASRVSAAVAVLEFGHGKARQSIEMAGDMRIELRQLSDADLDARIAALGCGTVGGEGAITH